VTLLTLALRGLRHHLRTHLAVALGVMAGTAVLAGALVTGDSMRGSLHDLSVGRLGVIDQALMGERLFVADLAERIGTDPGVGKAFEVVAPVLRLRGSLVHGTSGALASKVWIHGIDDSFTRLAGKSSPAPPEGLAALPPGSREIVLTRELARDLQAAVGDRVVLRVRAEGAIHEELLLGHDDRSLVTLRLTVKAIVSAEDILAFEPRPGQATPRNAFVALEALQKALDRPGRANLLLVSSTDPGEAGRGALEEAVSRHLTLADLGLSLRRDDGKGALSLESESLLLAPAIEKAALAAAGDLGLKPLPILLYLASALEKLDGKGEVRITPYSTVAALEVAAAPPAQPLVELDGTRVRSLAREGILLNDWTARDLGASPGDRLRLSYLIEGARGGFETRVADFTVEGIVKMEGLADDPDLAPTLRGITDATSIGSWDPPFPVDFSRIRDEDEKYWDDHRTTPKAFLDLGKGQELFAGNGDRFGRLTSIRFVALPDRSLDETAALLGETILARLPAAAAGLPVLAVRRDALAASQGATDFGMLFIGFSFFIVISAGLLVSLLFRLGVERRAKEVGTLLALGLSRAMVRRVFLLEGLAVSLLGATLGILVSFGYAFLMVGYLRTSFEETLGAGFLTLHVTPVSLAIGFLSGVVVSLLSVAHGLRGVVRSSPRALLSGAVSVGIEERSVPKRHVVAPVLAVAAPVLAAMFLGASVFDLLPAAAGFFSGGGLLLVGGLALLLVVVRGRKVSRLRGRGNGAMVRLGTRYARRVPRRTLSTVGLVASATFVLIAVGAFRQTDGEELRAKTSGTGGFSLLLDTTLPFREDLGTSAGRSEAGVSEELEAELSRGEVVSYRLSDGEESSCLNLYRPTRPRILGAPASALARGGFSFAGSLAETAEERENPWLLLRRPLSDGAIPAIGDKNSVTYQLKSGLGKDLVIPDGRGGEARLRFVALLSGSMLQGELMVSEESFLRLFPEVAGYGFFLVSCEPGQSEETGRLLEKDLSDHGVDAILAVRRLAELHSVENTYLSTFQLLGGLGLLLGTLGLGAVILRSVLERRGELALLRALGYRRRLLGVLVLAESGWLLVLGLGLGGGSALLAIAPQILGAGHVSLLTVAGSLLLVLIAGGASAFFAVVATLRAPLVPSLRSE